MEVVWIILSIFIFIVAISLINRVVDFITHTEKKLNEMDEKLEEIKKHMSKD